MIFEAVVLLNGSSGAARPLLAMFHVLEFVPATPDRSAAAKRAGSPTTPSDQVLPAVNPPSRYATTPMIQAFAGNRFAIEL